MRLHTTSCRLAGTDDRLVRVEIDRATEKVGGIWIEWRQRRGDQTLDGEWQPWDRHTEARPRTGLLSATQRAELFRAAKAAVAELEKRNAMREAVR